VGSKKRTKDMLRERKGIATCMDYWLVVEWEQTKHTGIALYNFVPFERRSCWPLSLP